MDWHGPTGTTKGARRLWRGCLVWAALSAELVMTAAGGVIQAPTDQEVAPLPSAQEVAAGLVERNLIDPEEKKAFAERYVHLRIRVREERNAKGSLRKRTEERKVLDPLRPAGEAQEVPEGREAKRAYAEDDLPTGDDLVRRYTYKVQGREELDGRTVLRVAFGPASKDLPQDSLLDKFINLTAGTLWLEESTYALVKAQMRLLDSVRFFGGITGIVYGLDMAFERRCTPEGVWYTHQAAWRADYRLLLVHKIVDFEERREDVRLAE